MPKTNAFYAQSGGVTAVINASACGVIETARKHKDKIGKVYAGRNGIIGALTEDLIDTSKESARAIAALRYTPSGAFGSARYKLKSLEENRAQYERLIEVFKAHNIGYFFYNGGGDSADTCLKVSQLSASDGLPDRLRARAQDRGQRSADHRLLPRLRLGRQVRRHQHPRSELRRGVDGEDLDQGVRAGSRWADTRAGSPPPAGWLRNRKAMARTFCCSPRSPSTRIASSHGRRDREEARLLRDRRVGRFAGRRRQVPVRVRAARRLRTRAARRRRAGDRQPGAREAQVQISLGGGRLSAACRASHRVQDRRRAGLCGGQGRGRDWR